MSPNKKKGHGRKHTRQKKWSGARRPAGPATTALYNHTKPKQKCILAWCGVLDKQNADIKYLQFVCLTLNTNSFIHLFQLLTDASYQWRLAKNTFQLSGIYGAQGDTEKKKEYIYTSLDIATVALGLDEQCAESHKWYNLFWHYLDPYHFHKKGLYTFALHLLLSIHICIGPDKEILFA